jgi:hypothetical protein
MATLISSIALFVSIQSTRDPKALSTESVDVRSLRIKNSAGDVVLEISGEESGAVLRLLSLPGEDGKQFTRMLIGCPLGAPFVELRALNWPKSYVALGLRGFPEAPFAEMKVEQSEISADITNTRSIRWQIVEPEKSLITQRGH